MAITVNGDTGAFYPNQDAVDNDTPIAASIVKTLDEPVTQAVIYVLGDPGYFVGPVDPPDVTTNPAPVSVASIAASYSILLAPAVAAADATALASGLQADLAAGVASGDNIPWSLTQGVRPGLWSFEETAGRWEERFAARIIRFDRGISSAPIASIKAKVRDVFSGGGALKMRAQFAERDPTTNAKSYTLATQITSAATGAIQVISLTPTLQPSTQSELRLEFETGADNAGAGGPFYEVIQIWTELA